MCTGLRSFFDGRGAIIRRVPRQPVAASRRAPAGLRQRRGHRARRCRQAGDVSGRRSCMRVVRGARPPDERLAEVRGVEPSTRCPLIQEWVSAPWVPQATEQDRTTSPLRMDRRARGAHSLPTPPAARSGRRRRPPGRWRFPRPGSPFARPEPARGASYPWARSPRERWRRLGRCRSMRSAASSRASLRRPREGGRPGRQSRGRRRVEWVRDPR